MLFSQINLVFFTMVLYVLFKNRLRKTKLGKDKLTDKDKFHVVKYENIQNVHVQVKHIDNDAGHL